MKKILVLLILFVGAIGAYLVLKKEEVSFESLSVNEMHKRIIAEREIAIKKAQAEGNYKCCIKPPCTMCFMEGNQWNNNTAGTCACDDILAQGKKACPQCERGLCQEKTQGVCKTK